MAAACSDHWCSTSLTIRRREPQNQTALEFSVPPVNRPLWLLVGSCHAPPARARCCSPDCSRYSVGHWLRREKADCPQRSARALASRRLLASAPAGRTLRPLASVPGIHVDPNARVIWSEIGYASWYGPNYHNKKAANGDIYNQNEMTAAHNTLPLNSIVRVVNLKSNQSTVVRITDRGPFIGDRIIDLSIAAAKAINVYLPGTAQVRLDVLEAPHPSRPVGGGACRLERSKPVRRNRLERESSDRYPGAGSAVQRSNRILDSHPSGKRRQGKDPRGLPAHTSG